MTNQATYRAAVVSARQLVERPIPAPTQGQVRIRVEACGVCHSDSATVGAKRRTRAAAPGHEVVGRIDALGEGCPAGGSASGSVWAFSPARIARAGRAATATS